ncbi:glycoside hydrolase [Micromonospora sp. NBC_01740]|uniref:sialidase family protein n=1 Tax=Micromonospora sp. NBC_01740 TaxID=2975986 RepID=UPI002E0E380F|nr:glycoside hydrolase [Micromonospora sp. NBC_01740]
MPDLDFAGLDRAAQAAFKPDFAEVGDRARRRRRTRAAALSLTALALVAAATTVGLRADEPPPPVPGTEPTPTPVFVPSPGPSASPVPGAGRPVRTGPMVAGDLDHFYLRWHDCRGEGCVLMVAGTADRGATWRSFPLPLPRDASSVIAAAGRRTLVAHYQHGGEGTPVRQGWLSSVDGGERWREVTPGRAAQVPEGWWVASHWLGRPFEEIMAADPVTGDLVQVPQTSGLKQTALVGDASAEAGIWASGYESETVMDGRLVGRGSAVAVSRDGGRTWHRHVFAGALTAGNDVALDIATRDGRTVYAVGRVGAALVVHRSDDGGLTWQRTTGSATVGERSVQASVRPDGALVVQAGVHAGDRPLMFISRDGGLSLSPTDPVPGAAADPMPGSDGYVQRTWPYFSDLWYSADGATWSHMSPPELP